MQTEVLVTLCLANLFNLPQICLWYGLQSNLKLNSQLLELCILLFVYWYLSSQHLMTWAYDFWHLLYFRSCFNCCKVFLFVRHRSLSLFRLFWVEIKHCFIRRWCLVLTLGPNAVFWPFLSAPPFFISVDGIICVCFFENCQICSSSFILLAISILQLETF